VLGGTGGRVCRPAHWEIRTGEAGGRIFVLGTRGPPLAIRELVRQRAADALDGWWRYIT
jgi:hypothetical protein